MARTDKKKQRETKKKQVGTSVRFTNPRTRLGLEEAKEQGVVVPQKNPDGRTFHWFIRGRKACWETKMNWDKDGYRFYQWNGTWQCSKVPLPSRARKRMRKV